MAVKGYKRLANTGLAAIMALHREAKKGDAEAAKNLAELNKVFALEANQRLSRLEKAGYKYYAYDIAFTYTQTVYGSTRYNPSVTGLDEQYGQILSMRTFLSKETSTVKGQKAVERERIRQFRKKFGIPEYGFQKGYLKNSEIVELLRLLGEKPIRKFLKDRPKGSEELVELINRAYQREDTARQDIVTIIREYRRTQAGAGGVPARERIYYSELIGYLKEGSLPPGVRIRDGKIYRDPGV